MLFKVIFLLSLIRFSVCIQEEEFDEATKYIDLSNRGIIEITTIFADYVELENIDLSENDIKTIEPDIFKTNTKLKRVDLSGNTNLILNEATPFLESDYLEELDLTDCNLKVVPTAAFDKLTNIKILDLTENPIDFEESSIFKTSAAPPKKIIISKINESDLKAICKHIDAEIEIKDEGRTVQCKNVAEKLDQNEQVKKIINTKNSDELDLEVEITDEGFITNDTHMDVMLSDEPEDGSGSGEMEVSSESVVVGEEQADAVPTESVPAEAVQVPAETVQVAAEAVEIPDAAAQDIKEDTSKNGESSGKTNEDGSAVVSTNNKQTADGAEDHTDLKLEPFQPKLRQFLPKDTIDDTKQNDTDSKPEADPPTAADEVPVNEGAIVPVVASRAEKHIPIPERNMEETGLEEKKDAKKEQEFEIIKEPMIDDSVAGKNAKNISAAMMDNETPAIGKDTEAKKSSGSNVILILVIGVTIAGSLGVVYKCVKDRKRKAAYAAVNIAENPTAGKELTEIKSVKPDAELEESAQPLMRNGGSENRETMRAGSTEFKEVDEASPTNDTKIEKPEDVKISIIKDEKAVEENGNKMEESKATDAVVVAEEQVETRSKSSSPSAAPRSLSVTPEAFE